MAFNLENSLFESILFSSCRRRRINEFSFINIMLTIPNLSFFLKKKYKKTLILTSFD
jgi:hypothetical protein